MGVVGEDLRHRARLRQPGVLRGVLEVRGEDADPLAGQGFDHDAEQAALLGARRSGEQGVARLLDGVRRQHGRPVAALAGAQDVRGEGVLHAELAREVGGLVDPAAPHPVLVDLLQQPHVDVERGHLARDLRQHLATAVAVPPRADVEGGDLQRGLGAHDAAAGPFRQAAGQPLGLGERRRTARGLALLAGGPLDGVPTGDDVLGRSRTRRDRGLPGRGHGLRAGGLTGDEERRGRQAEDQDQTDRLEPRPSRPVHSTTRVGRYACHDLTRPV